MKYMHPLLFLWFRSPSCGSSPCHHARVRICLSVCEHELRPGVLGGTSMPPGRSLSGPSTHPELRCACHVACEGRPGPSYVSLSPPLQELIHENMPEMGTESRGLLSSVAWPNPCHQDSAAGGRGSFIYEAWKARAGGKMFDSHLFKSASVD